MYKNIDLHFHAYIPGNPDPVANILGATFASTGGDDGTLARLIDQARDSEDSEKQKAILRLFVAFNNLDMQLMNVSLKTLSEWVIA